MMEMSPCKGCTDRHTACHGSCGKYKEWVDQYHAQQQHLTATKRRWQRPWSTARERTSRSYLKFNKYDRKQGGNQ